jgi:hypothetical protein
MDNKKEFDETINWTIKDYVGNSNLEAHIEGNDIKGDKYFATSYIGFEGEIVEPMNIVRNNHHSFDKAGNRFVNRKCINPKVKEVEKTYKKYSFEEVFGTLNNL